MMNLRLWKLKMRRIHVRQAILYLLVVSGFVAFVFTSSSSFYDEGGGAGVSASGSAPTNGNKRAVSSGGKKDGSAADDAKMNDKLVNANAVNDGSNVAAPARREPASADYVVNLGPVAPADGGDDATNVRAGGPLSSSERGPMTVRTVRSFAVNSSASNGAFFKGFTSRGLSASSTGGADPSLLMPSWWSTIIPSGVTPWFLTNGTFCPDAAAVHSPELGRLLPLWPDEDPGDRIIEQLMYVPPPPPRPTTSNSSGDGVDGNEIDDGSGGEAASSSVTKDENSDIVVQQREGHLHVVKRNFGGGGGSKQLASLLPAKNKTILLYNQHGWPDAKLGTESFAGCPVKTCSITKSKHDFRHADAVLFKDFVPAVPRPSPDQAWILYLLESPMHTQGFINVRSINWTATYRRDSDIVAPYAKWVYYDPKVTALPVTRNHAANKTKMVAWFVSNCHARNNRLQFVKELARHVGVDIYGACGNYKCPRNNAKMCFDLLNARYKFYLAFENSNCVDYITEKLFVNGLTNDVVPIVMGARPEDYARAAPKKSYIHVDDFPSAAALAAHLKKLDADDDAYNEYFAWKGTGEFMNTFFFCRLCAMLHDPARPAKEYVNLTKWWRLDAMCRRGSWNSPPPAAAVAGGSSTPSPAAVAAAKAAVAAKKRAAALSHNDVNEVGDYANDYGNKRKRRSVRGVSAFLGERWPVQL